MQLEKNFPLKSLNTFGIDIRAKLFVEVKSDEELKQILFSDDIKHNRKLFLGGGSNILFTKDFDGIVIKMGISGIKIISENGNKVLVQAGAGVNWNDLVLYCLRRNLGGIENLSLIPGTAGAAPIQNIGAYGVELKDVFHSLSGINTAAGTVQTFVKDQCSFGYRSSIFKHELKDKFVITSVTLTLSKEPVLNLSYAALVSEVKKRGLKRVSLQDINEIVCSIRTSKLPDPAVLGNAGSFFKNPFITEEKFFVMKSIYPQIPSYQSVNGKVKIAAGWLIEQSGWKGKRIGNAGAHDKQSLVIVNFGNATPQEILTVAHSIKKAVLDKFGIMLEEEVNII